MNEINSNETIISQSYEGEKIVESHDHRRDERLSDKKETSTQS